MSAYSASMSVRKLFAVLLAVAVLFAPMVTGISAAVAAVPDHQMQMMSTGHCKSASSSNDSNEPSGKDAKSGKSCCMAMCIAVTPAPAANDAWQPLVGVATVSVLKPFLIGLPAEIATPPPRTA